VCSELTRCALSRVAAVQGASHGSANRQRGCCAAAARHRHLEYALSSRTQLLPRVSCGDCAASLTAASNLQLLWTVGACFGVYGMGLLFIDLLTFLGDQAGPGSQADRALAAQRAEPRPQPGLARSVSACMGCAWLLPSHWSPLAVPGQSYTFRLTASDPAKPSAQSGGRSFAALTVFANAPPTPGMPPRQP
jgi:hypothetical protein